MAYDVCEVMKMKKTKVAVLYGGKGYEHDISVASGKYILKVIDRDRYQPIPIYIDKNGGWHTDGEREVSLSPTARALEADGIDLGAEVVLPMLHGDYGEDGSISGLLESVGIPYVGCGVSSGALLADKILTKRLAESIGIPTVPYIPFSRKNATDELVREVAEGLGYPVFVKPSTLGSSIGAGMANDEEELRRAIRTVEDLAKRGLVEKFIDNRREIEVGYLSYGGGEIITDGGEVSASGWYDYDEKYSDKSTASVIVRADLDSSQSERLRDYTRRLVDLFGIRQISRLDYFLSGDKIYLNEINTMPGFTENSLYPRLISASGISPTELVTLLIEGARE